ncbi:hypothetical protein GCM10025778_34580 [Paeniglutamicibacter antarcticus]|uniref:Uncharacterized protein n=1 Tax=Paeniglutamicibacter antarcticus TaxID=494023 RepID=A0ABP9TQ85_9MICC
MAEVSGKLRPWRNGGPPAKRFATVQGVIEPASPGTGMTPNRPARIAGPAPNRREVR